MSETKTKIWKRDWFLALAFSLLFYGLSITLARDAVSSLETGLYDLGVRLASGLPSDRIAVIAIDDKSIANIGRWPWSRNIHAELVERLSQGGAKVVASTVFFSEPQLDDGLLYIRQAREFIDNSALRPDRPGQARPVAEAAARLAATLDQADIDLNTDARLAGAIRAAGNVMLPVGFVQGQPLGRPDAALPPYLAGQTLKSISPGTSAEAPAIAVEAMFPPLEILAENASGLGHLIFTLDADGGARSLPLAVRYFDSYFPALALQVAARSLNLGIDDIRVTLGEKIELGNLTIRTTPDLRMYNAFYESAAGSDPFSVDSFYDVFVGQVPVDKFRNKIVLIGASATGIGDAMPTPVSASMAPVEVLAHIVSGILQEDFFTRPAWAWMAEIGLVLLIVLYLALLLPRLSAATGALVSGLVVALLLAVEISLIMNQSWWLRLVFPALFLGVGHLVMTLRTFRLTEQQKQRSEMDSAESNKMLGLAFQGQGQLDMAYEKFRRCPMDKSMMELLYNLALDYERKRQFNKAGAVYSHMAEYNIDYRDLRQRVKRSQNLEETLVLGRGSLAGVSNLVSEDGSVQKPMLGRYEIDKEIGKGAMGVVYLGRDPKINRVVAIKTIPLSEEFEEDDLADAKDRFFREAETAGRLNHPNIVTIFDAGEEHDLAYIAMEFLEGEHLNRNVKQDKLLPPAEVLDIIARTADALHYAHKQNVVHRDIKPANIMYEPVSGTVKVTDFGIARITDSSRTKTGIVLGTPSYMSPEQLGGQSVDGRSDLFSLGVTLYQLLTGKLPFQADSMGALMYKIANEAPAPLGVVRPDLPECLGEIIAKALLKDADLRYQTGEEMANAVRRCGSTLA